MASVVVRPASCVRGHITVPGDKSISHRYALLAALASGRSTVSRYAPGTDCEATLSCLAALGVDIDGPHGPPDAHPDQRIVTIEGRGFRGLTAPTETLDARNSGTTLRLLAGVLAGHPFKSVIGGDASLSRRPMRRVIAPLSRMGARLHSLDDRPPITVHGAKLQGIDFTPSVASAQVKSAVLLAGLLATGNTVVREQRGTRDHTERALPVFGVELARRDGGIVIRGGQELHAVTVQVPGDASAAAFWAVAAAALPGSDLTLGEVGLNPTRIGFLSVLERTGTRIDIAHLPSTGDEPLGQLRIRHGELRSFDIGPDEVPCLIDELPVLAALATHGGAMRVTGANELRHKESDRISGLATGIRGLGGHIEEMEDGFHVFGDRQLKGGTADAAGDHRLAMAFAVAALGAREPSKIHNAEAVDVSYPGFFDVLDTIRR